MSKLNYRQVDVEEIITEASGETWEPPPEVKVKEVKRLFALGHKKVGEMNFTEARYAKRLELLLRAGEIQWYRFDSIKVRVANNCWLTIDFFVMNKAGELEAHDVKGSRKIIQEDAAVKMKVVADNYPFRVFYAFPNKVRGDEGFNIVEL